MAGPLSAFFPSLANSAMNFSHQFARSVLLLLILAATAVAQQESRRGTGIINGEQVVGPLPGFKAVVLLSDSRLLSLRQNGALSIPVPSQLERVQSVVLKRPAYFKSTKTSVYAESRLTGQSMEVSIDESILDRIDYQPVEMKVYESGFSSILLRYVGGTERVRKQNLKVGDPKTDSPLVRVMLTNGNSIAGRIKGLRRLDFKSQIGDLKVDLKRIGEIEIIKPGKMKISMPNGDQISANIARTSIELLNRWENETLEMKSIDRIVIQRNATTASNPINRR